MKGVVFEKAGAEPQISDALEKPSPGSDQILVKSIFTAINPVDSYMSSSGLLVLDWPLVLGVDASGVVVEVGENASKKFKVGDEVTGCTRLGSKGYSTGQEYFLMDAPLTILKPKNITLQQGATLGVGTYTAALGIFHGLNIKVPDPSTVPDLASLEDSGSDSDAAEKAKGKEAEAPKTDAPPAEITDPPAPSGEGEEAKPEPPKESTPAPPAPKEDWVVVMGGSSSVGKYAIQLARVAGYNVAASCSASSAELVKELGAIPFDYKSPEADQVKEVLSITSNRAYRIFDAAATGDKCARLIFDALDETPAFSKGSDKTSSEKIPDKEGETEEGVKEEGVKDITGKEGEKDKDKDAKKVPARYFSTTNDWSGIQPFANNPNTHLDIVMLGPIGRGAEGGAAHLDKLITSYVPLIEALVEKKRVLPNGYDIVGKGQKGEEHWGDLVQALRYQQRGAGGSKKVLVRVGDE